MRRKGLFCLWFQSLQSIVVSTASGPEVRQCIMGRICGEEKCSPPAIQEANREIGRARLPIPLKGTALIT
jgi:hypothetical protein